MEDMDHLQGLQGSIEGNTGETFRFVPDPKLLELVTTTSITGILRESAPYLQCPRSMTETEYLGSLTSFIANNAVKIFAILVLVGKPWLIQEFQTLGVRDATLPVRAIHHKVGTDSRGRKVKIYQLESMRRQQAHTYDLSLAWKSPDVSAFCFHQWKFLSPIFDGNIFRHDYLEREVQMPYLVPGHAGFQPDGQPVKPSPSSYGEVRYKVIHAGHIRLSPRQFSTTDRNGNHRVAVKRLFSSNLTNANREAEILKLICDNMRSNHVIRAIAYFEKDDDQVQQGFIFPWATNGNLPNLWDERFKDDIKVSMADARFPGVLAWFFKQLAGLTLAVAEMHDRHNLRHGDIKPDNILCYHDQSQSDIVPIRLVLTDVGISKTHLKSTTERKNSLIRTTTTASTTRYAAPELNGRPDIDLLSTKYDVWSIGCVCVEFLFCLLYGLSEFTRFNQETDEGAEFYQTVSGTIIVRPAVDAWLRHTMVEVGRCFRDTALGVLIKLITEKLLVIDVESLQPVQQATPQTTTQAEQSTPRRPKSWWPRASNKRKAKGSGGNASPGRIIETAKPLRFRASAAEAGEVLGRIASGLEGGSIRSEWVGEAHVMRGPPSRRG
ncbi:kinase-like domain-containing protein [Podospora aff. communis PSN243]|uniref:Kinase-like domain-containing protein n=1 Tax=Podospora aff. communis PSN243 TaxID=3040156 RepID=A0AAV9GFX5_9PEZI|nr:kinase-like domain-containing protein [Podospora aff. communis PSN243]